MKRKSAQKTHPAASLKVQSKTYFEKVVRFAGTPLARKLIFGLFIVQAVILAFVVHIGTPPDETNHISFIEYYAHHSLSPVFNKEQPTYELGDKTREVGYLYHYSMSLVYRLSPVSVAQKYHIIRLFTVVFGVLTFIVLANVFRRLGLSSAVINVVLLILTNLPMVLMMSSAINNDILVWLGIMLGLLLLLQLWEELSIVKLFWLMALTLAGCLVKVDLIPVGLFFGLEALILIIKNFKALLLQLKRLKRPGYIALIVFIVSFGLFTERIGGNIARYHSITPTCEQVQGEEACYDFWINVRARGLKALPPEQTVSPAVFGFKWFGSSLYNIADIQTQFWHHTVVPARHLVLSLGGLFSVGLIYGLFYERKRFLSEKLSRYRVYIGLFALYYLAVNLLVNFETYRHNHIFGLALNGRYIIPSILILSGFSTFYWSKLLANHLRLRTVVAVLTILATILGSGLLMMLRNPQLHTGL